MMSRLAYCRSLPRSMSASRAGSGSRPRKVFALRKPRMCSEYGRCATTSASPSPPGAWDRRRRRASAPCTDITRAPLRELTWSGAVHPHAHGSAQYRDCLRGNLIAGPGNELVGADEHVFRLIALTAAGAPVADDLERDLQVIGSRGECAANCLLSVEAQERKSRPQPLKDVAPRRDRLPRDMLSRPPPH